MKGPTNGGSGYDELVNALRATDGHDADLAAATRLRLRRSLERKAHKRPRWLGLFASGGILCAGTAAWALAGGEIAALWAPAPSAQQLAAKIEKPVEAPKPRPVAPRVTAVVPVAPVAPLPEEPIATPAPAPVAPQLPVPVAPPAPPVAKLTRPAPRAVERPAAPTIDREALFQRAHELHFHGSDPAATLAAWDAYLAAAPRDELAVEARYNRALVLIRLARYAEARAALEPYARGEIAGGYRKAEAEQLVERLARFE